VRVIYCSRVLWVYEMYVFESIYLLLLALSLIEIFCFAILFNFCLTLFCYFHLSVSFPCISCQLFFPKREYKMQIWHGIKVKSCYQYHTDMTRKSKVVSLRLNQKWRIGLSPLCQKNTTTIQCITHALTQTWLVLVNLNKKLLLPHSFFLKYKEMIQ